MIIIYDITRPGCFMLIMYVSYTHTWPYFTWRFCYSHWYLTCQFILPSDLWFIDSSALVILPFTFTFPLLFPLLVCALAGPLLTDFDFSASELEETDELLFKGTQEDYQACVWSFLSYVFWHFFPCYDVLMPKLYLFYFCFVMFSILYPDKDYCKSMSFMWNETSGCLFVYVCKNLAPLL